MLKIIKNKKGFIANTIVLLICFVTFCIVGFIFYILFSFVGKLGVYDIGSDSESLNSNYLLLTYLRTPVEVNGNKMDMADLINLYYYDNNYEDILIEETKKILDSFEKPIVVSGWNLYIYLMPEDKTLIKIKTIDILGWYEKRTSFANIPLKENPEKYLRLKLYLECQDVKCY
jgi:hypothetical protein